jgi:hypothetical protein
MISSRADLPDNSEAEAAEAMRLLADGELPVAIEIVTGGWPMRFARSATVPARPLDRLLEALRATGPNAYRGDPEHLGSYKAYCPACASRLVGVRRLQIYERRDSKLSVTCSTGCSAAAIRIAPRLAERYYPATCAVSGGR